MGAAEEDIQEAIVEAIQVEEVIQVEVAVMVEEVEEEEVAVEAEEDVEEEGETEDAENDQTQSILSNYAYIKFIS